MQTPARRLRNRRHHQRHLHQMGRRISGALRRARGRAHCRRRDRRLPAHRDPGGCVDQSRGDRRDAPEISQARSGADRIRRRQSGGDLLAGACRHHDLRHRRRGRRQDPLEGRPRHHALGSAGHQQGRSRAARRSLARGDGSRCEEDAGGSGRSCSPISRPEAASIRSCSFITDKGGLGSDDADLHATLRTAGPIEVTVDAAHA